MFYCFKLKMGTVISKSLNCYYLSKYVCNACKFHSKCSDCCDVDMETTEIKDDEHEEEIECNDCFYAKRS